MGGWFRGLLPRRCLYPRHPLVFHPPPLVIRPPFTLRRWGLALRYLQVLSRFVNFLFLATQVAWAVLLVLLGAPQVIQAVPRGHWWFI